MTRPANVLLVLDDSMLQEVLDTLPTGDVFRSLLWANQDLKNRCYALLGSRSNDLTVEEQEYLATRTLSVKDVEASVLKLTETVKLIHSRRK